MIKGTLLKYSGSLWNCCLFSKGFIGIYRNNNVKENRYQVHSIYIENICSFNTFEEAVSKVIKLIKKEKIFNKYIPDIMRLTALIDEEDK